jgi:predicted Zn-dependent peptidase
MNRKLILFLVSIFMIGAVSAQQSRTNNDVVETVRAEQQVLEERTSEYPYETVKDDPLNTRIYTLDNGLKVFLTVYKDEPRISAYVAVRAGSKNDPAETTGLAHYFEHLMFKGTTHFGTQDYEKEKVLLAQIEQLYEEYRKIPMENVEARKAMYHIIDSVSYEASKISIPNEYDKLMTLIGASGTNAFTSLEQTVYVENIPSNQIENWAKIQADRFMHPVLRGFHTELETIYEEKNMTMTSDSRKMFDAVLSGLFLKHTYGTQTTIGTQDHIKNPSLVNIKNFHATYYVPNNVAICLSGDFDPDETIKIIDKYFGEWAPKEVPEFTYEEEDEITSPIVKDVYGPDAETIMIAFRLKGATSKDAIILSMVDMILANSTAGLIDLNIMQKQKALEAYSYPMINADYSALILGGKPKTGQTMDEVKDLLLEQLEKVKSGDFDEWLLQAIINDFKLQEMEQYESNESRTMALTQSFILGVSLEDMVKKYDRMAKITKEEIMAFANEKFNDNNYVVVYKHTGKDESLKKIKKNKITPIELNRDAVSGFREEMTNNEVAPVQPVFLNYEKDITTSSVNNLEILYKKNTENERFDLYYVFEMGTQAMNDIGLAINYLEFLGTKDYSPENLKKEFYKIGCDFTVSSGEERIYVNLNGLTESLIPALDLFESLMENPQANEDALVNMKSDILQEREDNKKNIQAVFGYLVSYGMFGENSPAFPNHSEKELMAITSTQLIDLIKSLFTYEHRILFYGNTPLADLKEILNEKHVVPAELKPVPVTEEVFMQETAENIVYTLDFETKQSQILMLSRGAKGYDPEREAIIKLFNEYFGGSMNSVVFQEMREARSLAYTAVSFYQGPSKKNKYYMSLSYIATQYDKMHEAISVFIDLMNNMPESEESFNLAKDGIIQNMRTQRTTKSSVLFSYLAAQDKGIDYDINKTVFETLQTLTFDDIKSFQQEYLTNLTYTTLIVGEDKEIDKKMLKEFGKVKKLKMKDVFGY